MHVKSIPNDVGSKVYFTQMLHGTGIFNIHFPLNVVIASPNVGKYTSPMDPMGVTLFLGTLRSIQRCRVYQQGVFLFCNFGDNSCLYIIIYIYIYLYLYTYLIIFDRKKHGPNGSKIDLFDQPAKSNNYVYGQPGEGKVRSLTWGMRAVEVHHNWLRVGKTDSGTHGIDRLQPERSPQMVVNSK